MPHLTTVTRRPFAALLLVALATALTAPARAADESPELPKPRTLKIGGKFYDITLHRAGAPMKVWAYLPDAAPASGKFPCVLIAPAGTRLYHGIALADGDRPEHIPYVAAGFAVLAYELDGPMGDRATAAQMSTAMSAFRSAEGGLANARAALDYAAAKIPQIDMTRIYAVGHSSAGTVALQVAQHDPRIAACVAFAPGTDLVDRLGPFGAQLDKLQPGEMAFLERLSPDRNLDKLKCPTMLFTARDDDNIPTASVARFAAALEKTNPHVKLVTVEKGGHHESMIKEGIPAAIEWLKALPAAPAPK